MENKRELGNDNTLSVSSHVHEVKLSRFTTIFAGVAFIIIGVIAYIANLNPAAAIILGAMGIPGIIAGARGSWEEKDD